jgi:hypothetical protein
VNGCRVSEFEMIGTEIITRRVEVQMTELVEGKLSASQSALKDLADPKFTLDQHAIVAITAL